MHERLDVNRVSVTIGVEKVVQDVTLQLRPSRIGCLLGPRGCGKTVLLRAIAGFEPIAQGAIHVDRQRLSGEEGVLIPPELRGIAMVFQDSSLFPHLNVGQNIAFGLAKMEIRERARRMYENLYLLGLHDLDKRHPHELSAEQQTRAIIARALATRPRLLIMDEPFARLDSDQGERLAMGLRDLFKEKNITVLFTTHDHRAAFSLADEIGVMSVGRLQQWGDCETIYQRPLNRFVATYIGEGTVVPVNLDPGVGLMTELGPLPLHDKGASLYSRPYLEIMLRPNHVALHSVSDANPTQVRVEVTRRIFRGTHLLFGVRLPSRTEVFSLQPVDSPYQVGDVVHASLKEHTPAVLHMVEQQPV